MRFFRSLPRRPLATVAICAGLAVITACPDRPRRVLRGPSPGPSPAPLRFVAAEAYRLFLLAELARDRGRPGRALGHLRAALLSDPASPYLRLRIAELLVHRGQRGAALAMVREAERVAPDFADSYRLHGELVGPQQPRLAEKLLSKATRLDPAAPRPLLSLARLRRRLGNQPGERRAYRRVLAARPEHAGALLALAKALARARRRPEALGMLRRLLAVRPFISSPRLLMARLLMQAGQAKGAEQSLREALEATADDPPVARELFRLYLLQGRRDRAVDLAALLEGHGVAAYLVLVAGFQRALGQTALEQKVLLRARALDAADPSVVRAWALLLNRRQGMTVARRYLKGIPLKSRAYVSAQLTLAELQAAEGGRQQALEILALGLRARPRSAAFHEARARILAKAGRRSAALIALETARRLRRQSPHDVAHRYALALVLEEAGQWAKARAVAEGLLRDDPDDAQSLNLLGYGLAERGIDLGRAARLLRRAHQLDPLSPYILDSLGWLHFKRGAFARAEQRLLQALRVGPTLCEPWHHLGDVRVARADHPGAVAAFRRALSCGLSAFDRAVVRGKLKRLGHRRRPSP